MINRLIKLNRKQLVEFSLNIYFCLFGQIRIDGDGSAIIGDLNFFVLQEDVDLPIGGFKDYREIWKNILDLLVVLGGLVTDGF